MSWKTIEGTNGRHQISDSGEVRRNDARGNYTLVPRANPKGYLSLKLRIGERFVNRYIHRLVAEHFIPNPNNYNVVNHINGNKQDNSVGNLEWCSKSKDLSHMWRNGLRKAGESGILGVGKTRHGRWYAAITRKGKRIHIGHYETKEMAGEAYRKYLDDHPEHDLLREALKGLDNETR